MPSLQWLDPWRTQGRQLLAALQPGERVLAFTATDVASTEPTIIDAPLPPPVVPGKPSRWWLLGGIVALLDWSPSLPFEDRLLDRLSHVSASGRIGSQGIRLYEELHAVTWDATPYLVVTDRRLVLLDAPGSLDSPFRLVAEVDRRAIVDAEVRHTLLPPSPGRLRVHFGDGSWIELADGFQMGRRRARQVREALLRETVSVHGEPGPPDAMRRAG
ncbi:MAG: hypothetical protein ABW219_05805 [Ilumatobacteraceae bacterium]